MVSLDSRDLFSLISVLVFSLRAACALARVGGGLHFLSVCFVFVTGSSRIQGPQRGKPHQRHDRQADRGPRRAGERRGRDPCHGTAGAPGMDFIFPTVPALSVAILKERIALENKGYYRETPGIVDEEASCAFSVTRDY